jgi:hypothetical protein
MKISKQNYSIVNNRGGTTGGQVQNYLRKMELKKQREEELTEGLKLYK